MTLSTLTPTGGDALGLPVGQTAATVGGEDAQALPAVAVVLHVLGEPASQGSKHGRPIYRGRGETREFTGKVAQVESGKKKLKPWRDAVVNAALDALDLDALERYGPLCGKGQPVAVQVTFTFARPKGHYRTGRNAHLLRDNAPAWPVTAIDVDKAGRATLDPLVTAGVLADDKQVVDLHAIETYPHGHYDALPVPGAVIRIWRLRATSPAHDRTGDR